MMSLKRVAGPGRTELGAMLLGAVVLMANPLPSHTAPATVGLTEVVIPAARDNTLYESFQGLLSNGADDTLFIGRTAISGQNAARRALLYFDIAAALPATAVVESVQLEFSVTEIPPLAQAFNASLHRVQADWGESTSQAIGPGGSGAPAEPGDATWLHRFFPDQFWAQNGGDFNAQESALTLVDGEGAYAFPDSTQLRADVQDMLLQPELNFGWMIRGSEAASGNARRLASREHIDAQLRPQLRVSYSGGLVLPLAQSVPTLSLLATVLLGLLLALMGRFVLARRPR